MPNKNNQYKSKKKKKKKDRKNLLIKLGERIFNPVTKKSEKDKIIKQMLKGI